MCHPSLRNRERDFVYKALNAIDRYTIKAARTQGHLNNGKGLCHDGFSSLREVQAFSKRSDLVLRESDKKMGWSLNTLGWYKEEYARHLKSDFYQRVGSVELTDKILRECRVQRDNVLGKHKDALTDSERKLLLGVGGEPIVLPSLNLMPKVHKLSDIANPENETDLKGRPIVTGYGWCTVGGSKILQSKLKTILEKLKEHMQSEGIESPLLGSSSDLVGDLQKFRVRDDENFMFVSFDFKDLYTNILFKDAERVIMECCRFFEIGDRESNLILDLYKFCNDCNYFNVGRDLFKQVKGVSMGCYFSKEISDLVLLHSEYQYYKEGHSQHLKLLRRYADDGLLMFSGGEFSSYLTETEKLMHYYPSNLVVNITFNSNFCQYLDLKLAIDDVSFSKGMVHYSTFFKPLHKFTYLDPSSDHPSFVFRGLIRTECVRYFRNSLTREDYKHTVDLFTMRLLKRGYDIGYIRRYLLSYKDNVLKRRVLKRGRGFSSNAVYVMKYSRTNKVINIVESLMRDAQRGAGLKTRIVFCKSVLPKLRDIVSTRRILHSKMERFCFT